MRKENPILTVPLLSIISYCYFNPKGFEPHIHFFSPAVQGVLVVQRVHASHLVRPRPEEHSREHRSTVQVEAEHWTICCASCAYSAVLVVII